MWQRSITHSGYVFREATTGCTVGNAIKRAAEAAGLPQAERCTGHSLQMGHITQASMERAPGAAIQAQSRHESDRAFQEARPAAKAAGEYTERASEAVD